jgi:signal transduction histidine kinase
VLGVLLAGFWAQNTTAWPQSRRVDGGWLAWVAIVQIGAWAWGESSRRAKTYDKEIRKQKEHRERARLAQVVADERLRIARELHDVVAHSVSVIALHAGAGSQVIKEHPEEAAKSLATIEETSRGAMRELRSLVGTLRSVDPRELTPFPSLDELEQVFQQARAVGLEVNVTVSGDHRSLPPGLGLTAFRIVQEAITNVIKHASAHRVDVRLTYGVRHLTLEVADNGRGTSGPLKSGHGLIGMRERVALYGGAFSAGPGVESGFVVSVCLPRDVAGSPSA